MKKALLFGATGFVGSALLAELLNNPNYSHVIAVVRKSLAIQHPKLRVLIGDYQSLPSLKKELIADEIFLALGTTRKNTPNQEEYYQVDHDYPILAAKIAKEQGAQSVFLVSAVGANAASNIFYVRVKGEVERDLIALNFAHTHIFRPSMILGNRQEKRSFEKALINIWSVINPILIGKLDVYKGISGLDIAKAMIRAAKNQTKAVKIYHWQEMRNLLSF